MKSFYIYLIVLIVFLLTIFLQINVFSIFTLVGTAANLGIILVTAIGLMTGEERGSILGGVFGFLIDIVEGKALGVYMLSYILLGYFTGRVGKDFSKENRTTLVAMVGVSTLVFEVFYYFFNILLYRMDLTPFYFAMEVGKEVVYNMLLAIIFFKFLYGLGDLINRTKDNYYML